MTSMEKAPEAEKAGRGCNGLLAIVDTACTKSVAGHDWFEEYADWAAEHGYQVVTSDHQEHFRFGASKVYVSTFLVRAWFAIRSRFFQVDVSIVPCSVPLLFSRPVLADLGMLYDVATEEVDLQALHLQKVKLWTSESGHPALWASDCGDKAIPDTLPPKRDGELHFAAEEAYMSAPVAAPPFPLFYPKKLPIEIQIMLSSPTLGGTGFLCWWKTVKQSRDFWVETETEFIRIHVVPRKTWFDPSRWNTSLSTLKQMLLKQLTGKRTTEYLPCLAAGTLVEIHHDVFSVDGDPGPAFTPWIGRSRFTKQVHAVCTTSPCTACTTFDAFSRPVAMEHEEGSASCRAERKGRGGAHLMDGAGAPTDPHRTARSGEASFSGQRQDEGPHFAQAAGAGGLGREGGDLTAHEAYTGAHDQVDSRSSQHPEPDGGTVRTLQGLHVPGGSRALPALGHPGEGQSELPRRLGQVGDLGQRGSAPSQRDGRLDQHEGRLGSRSRSPGTDPSAKDEEAIGGSQFI